MFLLCFYVISVRSDKAKIRYRGGGGGGGGGLQSDDDDDGG